MNFIQLQEIGRLKFQNPNVDFYVYLPKDEFFEALKAIRDTMHLIIEEDQDIKDLSQVEAWGIIIRCKIDTN